MGFFRGPDKIGQLSHSAGVISLGLPALSTVNRYTIRGQQYDFGSLSRTISADVTMVANTLYFVYALVSGGTVVLRISTSVPSAYKLANPTSELVAAFYSNNAPSVAFGSEVNIVGKPKTSSFINGGVNVITSQSTSPTKGNGGSPPIDNYLWARDGRMCITHHDYQHLTAGAAGGAGNYLLATPFPISSVHRINTQPFVGNNNSSIDNFSAIGTGSVTLNNVATATRAYQAFQLNPGLVRAFDWQTYSSFSSGGWGQQFYAFSNPILTWNGRLEFESSSFSDTQLKDL